MKITFKHLSLDQQWEYIKLGEAVVDAKREFIGALSEQKEQKREALKKIWVEFVTATVEKVDGADVNDVQNIDIREVLKSFFGIVLIAPE
jgi:hypothetical protein